MTSSNDASAADAITERALRIARSCVEGELLAIVGPTATGKTALAVALAERIGGEIVSCDSVQIYKEFDVGSGKPTADEVARAPHHLVSVLDPLEHVDAVGWAGLATTKIAEIRARGRVPIICGGTFFWTRALLYGLAEAPAGSPELRRRYAEIAEREGRPALHATLRAVDAESAARLHPNDFVRVSRALEVQALTGKPLSAWQSEHGFRRPKHVAKLIAIAIEPSTLTARIRARAIAWLGTGWVDEVRGLRSRGRADARALGSVGYAQICAALDGRLAADQVEDAIVRATRVFARRQRTWLNHKEVTWLA